MTINPKSLENLRPPMKPGETLNPGGKPKGARNRLQGDFMNALADDFEQHGKAAIVKVREEDPATYLRICASLMPKEIEATRPLDEFTDDELRAAVEMLRKMEAGRAGNADTRH